MKGHFMEMIIRHFVNKGQNFKNLHFSTFGLHATRVTARARSIIMIQTDTILSSLFLVWVKILSLFFNSIFHWS